MQQSRWRSKAAWVAIISLIAFVLKTYFHIQIAEFDRLVELVLLTASAVGIFNNPTDSGKF